MSDTLGNLYQRGLAVVQDAVADSTKVQYVRCWAEWTRFCIQFALDPLDAQSGHVVSYLVYISDKSSSSVSTAYTHLSSIAYHYRVHGKASITDSTIVSMYMKGLKRRNANLPLKQATPMTVDILNDLRALLIRDPRLVNWRTIWRVHLEFSLLLRFDDVKRLTMTDVSFEENTTGRFARIKLHGGKTFLTGPKNKNDRILIPNGTPSCVYELTLRYIAFLGDHQGSLQPSCAPGHPNRPHPTKSICYTLALQDLKNVVDAAGHDGSKFTEHSNKRGGATHAANLGVSEETIREIGNWKSVKTARLYIDQNTPLRQQRNSKIQKLL